MIIKDAKLTEPLCIENLNKKKIYGLNNWYKNNTEIDK